MALKHLALYPGPMDSPCMKSCAYDADAGLCRGCGRSLDEIADWGAMDQDARARVLAQLPERLRVLQAN